MQLLIVRKMLSAICIKFKSYPLPGCTAMPLGFLMSFLENNTALALVSRLATSIVNFFESVQNILRADQSIATPSGDLIPEEYLNSVIFLYQVS